MYKSPIEVITTNLMTEIKKSQDNQIYQSVLSVGVNVDKEELIKALSYDRQQYDKGYEDGYNAGKWISVKDRLPTEREYLDLWNDGTQSFKKF